MKSSPMLTIPVPQVTRNMPETPAAPHSIKEQIALHGVAGFWGRSWIFKSLEFVPRVAVERAHNKELQTIVLMMNARDPRFIFPFLKVLFHKIFYPFILYTPLKNAFVMRPFRAMRNSGVQAPADEEAKGRDGGDNTVDDSVSKGQNQEIEQNGYGIDAKSILAKSEGVKRRIVALPVYLYGQARRLYRYLTNDAYRGLIGNVTAAYVFRLTTVVFDGLTYEFGLYFPVVTPVLQVAGVALGVALSHPIETVTKRAFMDKLGYYEALRRTIFPLVPVKGNENGSDDADEVKGDAAIATTKYEYGKFNPSRLYSGFGFALLEAGVGFISSRVLMGLLYPAKSS